MREGDGTREGTREGNQLFNQARFPAVAGPLVGGGVSSVQELSGQCLTQKESLQDMAEAVANFCLCGLLRS